MARNVLLELITVERAKLIAQQLKGFPTENRVVIVSTTGELKSSNGIILPSEAKEGLPRKGTVVQIGHLGEGYEAYKEIHIGDILTYGLYAGKELEFDYLDEFLDPKKYTISVLSLNEIMYIERQ